MPITFPDTPRSLAQPEQLEERYSLLQAPDYAPLSTYIEQLRAQLHPQGLDVPHLDPAGGGVHSRILYLLEAPGPKAAQQRGGSGFISMDNDDQTARNVFLLTQQAGVNREWIASWNIVPWYVGNEERIRAVTPAEVVAGQTHLRQLVRLLPDLRVVVTLGKPAAQGWNAISAEYPQVMTLATWHPSGQALNAHPARRAHILETFRLAQHLTEYAHNTAGPTWSHTEQ